MLDRHMDVLGDYPEFFHLIKVDPGRTDILQRVRLSQNGMSSSHVGADDRLVGVTLG